MYKINKSEVLYIKKGHFLHEKVDKELEEKYWYLYSINPKHQDLKKTLIKKYWKWEEHEKVVFKDWNEVRIYKNEWYELF